MKLKINDRSAGSTLDITLQLEEIRSGGLDVATSDRSKKYKLVGLEVVGDIPPELQAVLDALATS